MKKTYLLGTIVLAAFLLAGCQQEELPVAGPTFVGGTQGISMEFLKDAPPNEIFDGGKSPFNINVRMKNVGEWQIASGADIKMTISGIAPADYGVSEASLIKNAPQGMLPTRRGPAGEILEGDTIVMDFAGLNYQRTLFGDVPATIRATACYKYGTKVSSNICVKKDLSTTDRAVCIVNEAKAVANSGAPVHIVSMRESQGGPDLILLTFAIRHVGTGKILSLIHI